MTKKWVFSFGGEQCVAPDVLSAEILGGKGYGLAVMSGLGIAVPSGFTIITDACSEYYKNDRAIPDHVWAQVVSSIKSLERWTGKNFGAGLNPLLLSVRSGSVVSMPGMMDTVLNLGLNDEVVEALALATGDARFAYDSYRRFVEMYACVVMGVDQYLFENKFSYEKQKLNLQYDWQLDVDTLRKLVLAYKEIVFLETGAALPQDVFEQLKMSINAVFNSWDGERAIKYRMLNDIPNSWGTAVNVQSMVFGNIGADSLTGVLFTRNPSNGEKELFGEFLVNAQGEDLVAGVRTPAQITNKGRESAIINEPSLEETNPKLFEELKALALKLEDHFLDMQDIEFTVEKDKLWLLQTRKGKRAAKASVKIAIDMLKEGKISKEDVLKRVEPHEIEKLLHHAIDENAVLDVMTRGLPASPGAASGAVVFCSEDAEALSKKKKVILIRKETSPEDIGGMAAAEGILTTKGGMTSHAAVVARGMGKPCICGADTISINEHDQVMIINGRLIHAGDIITINGATGEVIRGEVATIKQKSFLEFTEIMNLADSTKKMVIRANAETPKDAQTAREFGAEGIGLCRTEHMFFDPTRITAVRKMIFAASCEERKNVLQELLIFQREDFKSIFEKMSGLPVTIRLLDPPLHEFLPISKHEIESFAQQSGLPISEVESRAKLIAEVNPMLGHRGARLAITYPEIYEMQIQAIFEAASALGNIIPEIMIPLVFNVEEVRLLKELIAKVHERVAPNINYIMGVMIELPRAAIVAGDIAPIVDFFSFGTNDLTQTTLGLSRDDAGKFLSHYKQKDILKFDPFVTLDQEGVGELIKMAVSAGKASNPNLKIGVCGEHGGDPRSIKFFNSIGIDYVSCSPYRVPVARIAASRAALDLGYC